jgi:hypothetical protein
MERKIKLITNCERPPNYLMDIAIKYWLRTFKESELIFLVNNISHFDMVESLKEKYNINAKRVHSIDDIYDANQCVVWDDLEEYDYGLYHDREAPIINAVQHKLLQEGVDVVIFLDRDEILYHPNLREVLNTFPEPVIRPRGIEVIQYGNEESYNDELPLYKQRKYLRYFPSKSKACIVRQPVHWMIGRHGTLCGRWPHADVKAHPELQTHPDANTDEYADLYLVHFDKIDIDLIYQLRMESQSLFKTNDRHTGVIDVEKFSMWFNEAALNGELYEDNDNFLERVDI